jgi:hypothetical protein
MVFFFVCRCVLLFLRSVDEEDDDEEEDDEDDEEEEEEDGEAAVARGTRLRFPVAAARLAGMMIGEVVRVWLACG